MERNGKLVQGRSGNGLREVFNTGPVQTASVGMADSEVETLVGIVSVGPSAGRESVGISVSVGI